VAPKPPWKCCARGRGTEFDPELVDLVCGRSDELLGDLVDRDVWDDVLATDPSLGTALSEQALTSVLEAFGDYADVKYPYWLGHSRRVADLARRAAERAGVSTQEQTLIERAALVHDLGAIGVSSGVWDKRGILSRSEQERVRTHPYLTERVLARPGPLAPIGHLAAMRSRRCHGPQGGGRRGPPRR
jgi:HD-GYP domain-containing protein (c-di-GMP phosphodiesterase class II)